MPHSMSSPTPASSHLWLVRDEDAPAYDGMSCAPAPAKRGPFAVIDHTIYDKLSGDGYAFAVYGVLVKHANKEGTCWPAIATICAAVGWSRKVVEPAIKRLIAAGLVTKQRRQLHGMDQSSVYQITAYVQVVPTELAVVPREPLGSSHGTSGTFPRNYELEPIELDTKELTTPPTPSPGEPAKRSRKRKDYTEDFEAFWQAYPKDHGTKSLAFTEWQKLDGDDQAAAVASLPAFKASRRWQEGYIRDAERFLKYRQWESPPSRNGSANGMEIDWKTATPEQKESYRLTREREMLRQL